MPNRFRTYTLGESGLLFGSVPSGTVESVTLIINGVFTLYPDGGAQNLPVGTSGIVKIGLLDLSKAQFTQLTGTTVAYSELPPLRNAIGANNAGLEQ